MSRIIEELPLVASAFHPYGLLVELRPLATAGGRVVPVACKTPDARVYFFLVRRGVDLEVHGRCPMRGHVITGVAGSYPEVRAILQEKVQAYSETLSKILSDL